MFTVRASDIKVLDLTLCKVVCKQVCFRKFFVVYWTPCMWFPTRPKQNNNNEISNKNGNINNNSRSSMTKSCSATAQIVSQCLINVWYYGNKSTIQTHVYTHNLHTQILYNTHTFQPRTQGHVTYAHTYTSATSIRVHMHKHTQTCTHTQCMQSYTHTHTHTQMEHASHTQSWTHTQAYAPTHPHPPTWATSKCSPCRSDGHTASAWVPVAPTCKLRIHSECPVLAQTHNRSPPPCCWRGSCHHRLQKIHRRSCCLSVPLDP